MTLLMPSEPLRGAVTTTASPDFGCCGECATFLVVVSTLLAEAGMATSARAQLPRKAEIKTNVMRTRKRRANIRNNDVPRENAGALFRQLLLFRFGQPEGSNQADGIHKERHQGRRMGKLGRFLSLPINGTKLGGEKGC